MGTFVNKRLKVGSGAFINIRDWKKQNEILNRWNKEICSGNTLPEVEIISLLEEQIPKYKLRADTITKFGGYENQDWFIPTPALQIREEDLKLSPDQIRETLNYFLLCSNRVSQMTKTYDDVEAISRLLEEKEKDLELTARIGKELLEQNGKLENTVGSLESDLKSANEKIIQLTHEISKKGELIQVLTNDMDESTVETGLSGCVNLELMQKKIGSLEDENKTLKTEFYRLVEQTDDIEAKEKLLLKEMIGELSCANSSVGLLEDEMSKMKEENRSQHEQILILSSKLADTEARLKKVIVENEESNGLLQITRDTQNSLAFELAELKTRYLEIEGLLHDAQEQLRKTRRKNTPTVRSSAYSSLNANYQLPFDSLQSELEQSIHSESSVDSGIASDSTPYFKRVFDTLRYASHSSLSSGEGISNFNCGYGGNVMSSMANSPRVSVRTDNSNMRRSSGSVYSNSSLGYPSLDSTGHSDNESSQTDSEDGYPGPPKQGIPGAPGAADLQAALRRITPAEVDIRRANLQFGLTYRGYDSDSYLQYGCRTPDSLMSTGSNNNYPMWKLPEKLQIVKPLEGSQTLHHWSQLARPTFGGLLEERPGVKIRCGKELEDIGLELYALSDVEEDDEYSNPGKIFESSLPVYTLTNSMVMHPDDGTFATMSNRGSCITSACSSIQNSPPSTPKSRSRRNSTCTYSTTYGLAKMLNERGIKAITPSAYNTPSGPNSFTPTATPCNSPDETPISSRSNSPEPNLFNLPHRILSSIPEFFQQNMKDSSMTKTDKRRDNKQSIVPKIERIGVSNLMTTPGALSISAGIYGRPDLTSPMAQLTCLLPNNQNNDGKMRIDNQENSVSPSMILGVPGRPGSDALNIRLSQLNNRKNRKQGTVRHDLGTVKFNNPEPEQASSLGTLSSLLFGRKGGLF